MDTYSSRLCIDLGAICANYRTISARIAPAHCGAVVKANAYGLGSAKVATALFREGCRAFFVARFCEAKSLARTIGTAAEIYVLNGLEPGNEATCAEHGCIPVLNSLSQVNRWRAVARQEGRALPAALQVDSGMSRLGLPVAAAISLAKDDALSADVDLRLIMTHLACSDEPAHAANAAQLAHFRVVQMHFPGIRSSISNSGGIFLGKEFHGDLGRPGLALFGVDPGPHAEGIRSVVRLDAQVIQIRRIKAGTGVGYGLSYVATVPQRLATIAIGYADGWPRCLGGAGAAWHRGIRLPIVGRISMDSLTVDIGALPEEALQEDDFVELIGPSQSLADASRDAGTVAYEMLTRLGERHMRIYLADEPRR
jgi:alanine racemase